MAFALACHTTTETKENFVTIEATFNDSVPATMSPGQEAVFHLEARITGTPAGPVYGNLEWFADKNLKFEGLAGTNSSGQLVQLRGIVYTYDQLGLELPFGPLNRGDTAWADVKYRVIDNPVDYHEPPGFLAANLIIYMNPPFDGVHVAYSTGVYDDRYIQIVSAPGSTSLGVRR